MFNQRPIIIKLKEVTNKKAAIKQYAWNDEEKKIKVYIDLAQFPTMITQQMIDVKF